MSGCSTTTPTTIVNGTIAALLVVIVLAALFATSEYRRGRIRTTFAASPRRGQVLAAKAVVAGSLAFAAGAIATALAEVITRPVLAASGSYLFPQSGPDLARVIIGTGLLLGLAAALAVALGTMLRRSAATVAAGIVLLVLPGILGSQSGNWLMRFTPTAAFAIQATLPRSSLVTSAYTPPNGYFPVSPWVGPRRTRRLHRGSPGRSHVAGPPPIRANAALPFRTNHMKDAFRVNLRISLICSAPARKETPFSMPGRRYQPGISRWRRADTGPGVQPKA